MYQQNNQNQRCRHYLHQRNEKLDSILEDTSTDLNSEAEEVMQITDEDVKKYKNESEQKQMEFLEQQRNFKDSLGDKTKKKK